MVAGNFEVRRPASLRERKARPARQASSVPERCLPSSSSKGVSPPRRLFGGSLATPKEGQKGRAAPSNRERRIPQPRDNDLVLSLQPGLQESENVCV